MLAGRPPPRLLELVTDGELVAVKVASVKVKLLSLRWTMVWISPWTSSETMTLILLLS